MKFSPVIQYLRALAAIMVLVYHVVLHWIPAQKPYYAPLAAGVDIFFVISGFVMWGVTAGRDGQSWAFIINRVRRIVPLYWLLTTLMLVVLVIYPEATRTSRFDLGHVISSYFFLPAIHPVKGTFEPLMFPGWTLNYEMMFYLLFALALLGPIRWRLPLVLTPLIALVALGAIPHSPTSLIGFYSNSILLEFGMGVTLAWFVNSPAVDRLPRFVGVAMLLACPLAFALAALLPDAPRALAWGVPAALFVSGCVFNERARGTPRIPFLQLLGDASYSIYLSHVIILSAAFQAVHRLASAHGVAGEVAASVLIVTVAIAGGVAVYWFVERRLIQLFKTPGVPPGHPVASVQRALVTVSGKQPAE